MVRLRLVAWVLSAALMGLGGALWAQYNLAFGPRQFFFPQTFAVLAMIVVGGLASVSGAVIGASVITIATEVLRRVEDGGADLGPLHVPGTQGMTPIALALMILLVLRVRRDGLVGCPKSTMHSRAGARGRDGRAHDRRSDQPRGRRGHRRPLVTAGAPTSCTTSTRPASSTASR